MSKPNDIWYPVVTAHVEYQPVTIPPTEELGTPQMPGIQVALTTTVLSANPIQLTIPVGTAQGFARRLGGDAFASSNSGGWSSGSTQRL